MPLPEQFSLASKSRISRFPETWPVTMQIPGDARNQRSRSRESGSCFCARFQCDRVGRFSRTLAGNTHNPAARYDSATDRRSKESRWRVQLPEPLREAHPRSTQCQVSLLNGVDEIGTAHHERTQRITRQILNRPGWSVPEERGAPPMKLDLRRGGQWRFSGLVWLPHRVSPAQGSGWDWRPATGRNVQLNALRFGRRLQFQMSIDDSR